MRFDTATAMRAGITMALLAVVLIALILSAGAHDWYPPYCCSGGDCAPIAGERVEQQPGGGYIVDHKFVVPRSEVKDSMDGRYHGCFPTPDSLKCFFAPPPGA